MAEEQIPTKYLINVPGVYHGTTVATSAPSALAQAMYHAFQTRNKFMWEGRAFEGEVGLKTLINEVMASPAFFEMVQQLPGMPSKPVVVPLPMQQEQPDATVQGWLRRG